VQIILFIAIGIFIGLILSYPEIQKIFSIYRTPIYQINKLPTEGRIIVFGTAESKNTKSPIKHTNCSLWQVEVTELPYVNNNGVYKTLYSQISKEPFELSDKTGNIQIFPANAELILYDDVRKAGNLLSPMPSRTKNAIEELGIPTVNSLGVERQLQVYERFIKPGDVIYVLGEVGYENGSKVIKSGDPFVISDRREYKVVEALFKHIAVKALVTAVFVFTVLMYFFYNP
jgi:hypothetical protein